MARTSRTASATTPELAQPLCFGDSLSRDNMMPAGGKLDNTTFGAADADGRLPIPAGTAISRSTTDNESAGSLTVGMWQAAAATDDVFSFVAFDVTNALINDDVEVVRPNCNLVVYVNYLPGPFSTLDAGVQAALRAAFNLQHAID